MKLLFNTTIHTAGVPKGRARATRSGHHYTPTRTRMFESAIRMHLKTQYRQAAYAGPVCLVLDFDHKSPKRPTREYPTKCGDCSNLAKALEDASNGVLFVDDVQIVKLVVTKRWADQDAIRVSLWAVDQDRATGLT